MEKTAIILFIISLFFVIIVALLSAYLPSNYILIENNHRIPTPVPTQAPLP